MFRKKRVLIVPEGKAKQDILDAISAWQASDTIRTHESLWDLFYETYPEWKTVVVHFNYQPLTKVLRIMEGNSKDSWIKYTF